jgi:hypothetical protein
MGTLTYTGTLNILSCWCGIEFAVPDDLYEQHRSRGGVRHIYCPLGHSAVWQPWETDADRLRAAEARERHLEDQLGASERRARSLKGHLTRLRNRIAAGVCPWCHRTFKQVEAHVRSQHPERTEQMRDALHP